MTEKSELWRLLSLVADLGDGLKALCLAEAPPPAPADTGAAAVAELERLYKPGGQMIPDKATQELLAGLVANCNVLAERQAALELVIAAQQTTIGLLVEKNGIAFSRIAECLVELGADIQGAELGELRRIFDAPSPDKPIN